MVETMTQLFNTEQGDQESPTISVWGGALIPVATPGTKLPRSQQVPVPDARLQTAAKAEKPKSILKNTINFSGAQRDNCVPH